MLQYSMYKKALKNLKLKALIIMYSEIIYKLLT